jgi:hypothetical protein
MTLREWNAMQVAEALGDVNRYFFWQHHNREPINDDELVIYYATNGGAYHYYTNHKQEREVPNGKENTPYKQASSEIKK